MLILVLPISFCEDLLLFCCPFAQAVEVEAMMLMMLVLLLRTGLPWMDCSMNVTERSSSKDWFSGDDEFVSSDGPQRVSSEFTSGVEGLLQVSSPIVDVVRLLMTVPLSLSTAL